MTLLPPPPPPTAARRPTTRPYWPFARFFNRLFTLFRKSPQPGKQDRAGRIVPQQGRLGGDILRLLCSFGRENEIWRTVESQRPAPRGAGSRAHGGTAIRRVGRRMAQ